MTMTELRKLLASKPFRAFTLHMADGRKVLVKHPEFVAVAPNGRTAVVYQPNSDFEIVDLFLVTSLKLERRRRRSGKARQKS